MGSVLTDVTSIDGQAFPIAIPGQALALPGTLSKPPSIAGGGWAFVHNTGSPIASAVDMSYGIQLTVPNASSPPSNLGYVRAISGSSTASVESGQVCQNNRTLGDSGPQQMLAGVMMYESASNKYLNWQVLYYEDGSGNSRTGLYIVGTSVGGVSSGGLFSYGSQVFVRMRLDGLGNIISDFSLDKQTWQTMSTIAVTTAFTTAPDHVGIPLSVPLSGGTQITSVFDFATT
jgi:hypothetical protein